LVTREVELGFAAAYKSCGREPGTDREELLLLVTPEPRETVAWRSDIAASLLKLARSNVNAKRNDDMGQHVSSVCAFTPSQNKR